MDIIKTKELVTPALVEAFGKDVFQSTYATDGVLDSYKLVDVGHDIGDDTTNTMTEKFLHSLLSLMGKMDFIENTYTRLIDDLMIQSFEWGGILERVIPQLNEIIDDPLFNKTDGTSYAELEHTFYQPKIEVRIFNEMKPIAIPISISVEDTKEAFTSWESMNAFIMKLRNMVFETKKLVLDTYAHLLVSVAGAVSVKATQNNIKLVTDAQADGIINEEQATDKKALLQNDKFLAYCSRKIADVKDNMRAMSVAYNNGNFPVQCMEQNSYVLTQFVNAYKSIPALNSNGSVDSTFDNFTKLPAWQMIKKTGGNFFDWEEVSKVKISADPSNKLGLGTGEVEVDNLVAVVVDKRAMGICPYREKVTSNYTACADFWTEWTHIFINYYLDSNFPIVAFTLD